MSIRKERLQLIRERHRKLILAPRERVQMEALAEDWDDTPVEYFDEEMVDKYRLTDDEDKTAAHTLINFPRPRGRVPDPQPRGSFPGTDTSPAPQARHQQQQVGPRRDANDSRETLQFREARLDRFDRFDIPLESEASTC